MSPEGLPTVLVVDDDAGVRKMLRTMLQRAGLTVLEAADGRECLALARANSVAVAIVDLVMPEMNGLEILNHLRAARPGVKIMVISGALAAELDVASRLGADMVITKPIQRQEFLNGVFALAGASPGASG